SPRNAAAVKGKRTITLNGATMQAVLYERARLDVGATVAAPAIVEQFDATTLIPPSWSGRVDGHGNLVLTRAWARTPSASRSCATKSQASSRKCTTTSTAPAIRRSSANRGISAA